MGKKHADARTLSVVCEELILMLGAGVPLHESIDALAENRDDAAPLFEALRDPLQCGAPLSGAMEEAGCFPADMIGMIRAGEEAGQLERVLMALAAHYARMHRTQSAAADALRYPLTMLMIITLVIFVLVFQVTPILEKALSSLGADGFAEGTMAFSCAVSMGVWALCIAALIGAGALALLVRSGRHPQLCRRVISMLPGVARVQRLQAAERFASMLSVLMRSGVPMERAMEMLADSCALEEDRARVLACGQKISADEGFSAAFGSTGLFDPLYIRMMQAGFVAGQADMVLEKTAQMISQEIDATLARLVGRLEPALVIVMGTLLGAVLLAVMAPMSGVLGTIG